MFKKTKRNSNTFLVLVLHFLPILTFGQTYKFTAIGVNYREKVRGRNWQEWQGWIKCNYKVTYVNYKSGGGKVTIDDKTYQLIDVIGAGDTGGHDATWSAFDSKSINCEVRVKINEYTKEFLIYIGYRNYQVVYNIEEN